MEEEIWKDVVGFEGYYQISNMGRIKSLSRILLNGRGSFRSREKIMIACIDGSGYFQCMMRKDGIAKSMKSHKQVAISFLGHNPSVDGLVVDHINGNISDNRLVNLRLVTHRENVSVCFRKNQDGFTSKFVGVHWNKDNNNWRSDITVNCKCIKLGSFLNEVDASNRYKDALEHVLNNTFEDYYETIKRKCSSKFVGVSFRGKSNKWRAEIRINGKHIRLGDYLIEQDASNAYQNALKLKTA